MTLFSLVVLCTVITVADDLEGKDEKMTYETILVYFPSRFVLYLTCYVS